MSEIVKKSAAQKNADIEVEGFRKARGPFVVAAETTRMAMDFTDAKEPDNPIICANDSFLTLTGYDREEVFGQSFNFLMARGADQASLKEIASARAWALIAPEGETLHRKGERYPFAMGG